EAPTHAVHGARVRPRSAADDATVEVAVTRDARPRAAGRDLCCFRLAGAARAYARGAAVLDPLADRRGELHFAHAGRALRGFSPAEVVVAVERDEALVALAHAAAGFSGLDGDVERLLFVRGHFDRAVAH